MSLKLLSDALESLPYSLKEQVLGYARSISEAAPEIFKEAGVRRDNKTEDTLVFLAGMKKLFSIVDSNYWVIDNAGAILEKEQSQFSVRIGGSDFSRGGDYLSKLDMIRKELNSYFIEQGIADLIESRNYSEIVRTIQNGR